MHSEMSEYGPSAIWLIWSFDCSIDPINDQIISNQMAMYGSHNHGLARHRRVFRDEPRDRALYARRARGSTTEFFLSGRNVPWWLAGTSMVATTFAADTPLVVTGIVARYGIAGNWLWWNMVASGMLTVFVYARLWRRSGVMTDVEFAEIRYAGKPAAFLRGFRALYLGLPINCIVIGWVNLAMMKILQVTLGLDDARLVGAAGDAGVHGVLHDDRRTLGRAASPTSCSSC